VKFVSSDAVIKKTLEKLGDVLVRNEAWLHPDLRVVCEDGNFSMHASAPVENGGRAVYIPPACVVHPRKFSFSLNGNNIVIESVGGDVSALEQEIAALVIELYNLAGKLEQYKKNSVYCLYHEAPDLFLALTKACIFQETEHFEKLPSNEAFLKAFFKLRTVGKEQIIVPLIEYFNHDRKVKIDRIITAEGAADVRIYVPPGKDEFFINYGLPQDAHAFFLYQGFLDQDIQVLTSLPIEFSIEDINISVGRKSIMPTLEELPKAMKNLYGYCPYFNLETEHTVKFGFLYIPSKSAPLSLRRILHFGIRRIMHSDAQATQIMLKAEQKIISENLAYYEDLKKLLDDFNPSAQTETFIVNAKEMLEYQLSIIRNYPFFYEAMIET